MLVSDTNACGMDVKSAIVCNRYYILIYAVVLGHISTLYKENTHWILNIVGILSVNCTSP